jgi:hypothetical protein
MASVTFLAPMVVALPELVTSPVRLAFVVTVAAFPVQDPEEPVAFPVTLPVKAPTKEVAVSAPVLGLKDSFVDEIL